MKTKLVYNNFQFYETATLSAFLDKQAAMCYKFCGAIGAFMDILKFRYDESDKQIHYFVLHNRWDD